MIKKISAFILASLLAFAFCACGEENVSSISSEAEETSVFESSEAMESEESFEDEETSSISEESVIESEAEVSEKSEESTESSEEASESSQETEESSEAAEESSEIPEEKEVTDMKYAYEAPVFTGKIENEAKPEKVSDFIGAIYHKVVSSKDDWLGIEATVTLPEFYGDESRVCDGKYGVKTRFMDNPSVYLGSEGKYITDCGLTLSPVRDPKNLSAIYPDGHKAYRPFWRYQPGNNYANSSVTDYTSYYYPGDVVRMSLYCPRENYLQLRIELIKETEIPEYAEFRKAYKLGNDYNRVFLSPEFPSESIGSGKAIFRRVNAIDQVNNEGKPTAKTNAKSLNTVWQEVYLYRNIGGKIYKIPMTPERCSVIDSPTGWKDAFVYSSGGFKKESGGENITLDPHNNK